MASRQNLERQAVQLLPVWCIKTTEEAIAQTLCQLILTVIDTDAEFSQKWPSKNDPIGAHIFPCLYVNTNFDNMSRGVTKKFLAAKLLLLSQQFNRKGAIALAAAPEEKTNRV